MPVKLYFLQVTFLNSTKMQMSALKLIQIFHESTLMALAKKHLYNWYITITKLLQIDTHCFIYMHILLQK